MKYTCTLMAAAALALTGCSASETESPITELSIRAHMEFLASDALNGRGSGTRDEWLAATYVASMFRQWNLEPFGDDDGFVQQIDIDGSRVTAPPTLTAGGSRLLHGNQMLVISMPAAESVGKLVVYQDGMSLSADAAVLVPADAENPNLGGAGIVLQQITEQRLAQWDARAARMPTMPSKIAGVAPTARAGTVWLNDAAYQTLGALPAGTDVVLSAEVEPLPTRHTWNAVGRLTGSDPQASAEVIVLSAHLDHTGARDVAPGEDGIYNGADDDASGTVAVMELARALALGPRPARTLVFALFGSEERGGIGAGYFVDRPVVPLGDIIADLQFEMLGRPDDMIDAQTLWLTGYERSNLGAELAAQGARLVADPHPDQNFFSRSDNIRFARRGVVAHTVSSFGLHTDYHQPSDEIGMVDFPHMTRSIQSMLEPVRWFANSDFTPAWTADGCPAPCGQ